MQRFCVVFDRTLADLKLHIFNWQRFYVNDIFHLQYLRAFLGWAGEEFCLFGWVSIPLCVIAVHNDFQQKSALLFPLVGKQKNNAIDNIMATVSSSTTQMCYAVEEVFIYRSNTPHKLIAIIIQNTK